MVNASQTSLSISRDESARTFTPFQPERQSESSYTRNAAEEQLRHNRLVASYLAETRPSSPLWQRSSHRSNLYTQSSSHAHFDSHDTLYSHTHNTPPPPAVQPQHRVYVLRCAHCDTFVSDRGMRAVLLLRPHITLFSTDACPSSCGPLYSSNDLEPKSELEQVERTCDCLTQSLGCFCCGNVIGCKHFSITMNVKLS